LAAARKLTTELIMGGDKIFIGEWLEIRVLPDQKKPGGKLRIQLLGDADYPVSVYRPPKKRLSCRRREK